MGQTYLGQIASPGSSQVFFVSFENRLRLGELITGTPTVTGTVNTIDVSADITAVAFNATALVDGALTAAIARAVEWRYAPTTSIQGTQTAKFIVSASTSMGNTDIATAYLLLSEEVATV